MSVNGLGLLSLKTNVKCPRCNAEYTVYVDSDSITYASLVYCSPGDGGCDSVFAVRFSVEITYLTTQVFKPTLSFYQKLKE